MIGMKEISLVLFLTAFVVISVESDESPAFDREYDLVMDPIEQRLPDIMDKQRRPHNDYILSLFGRLRSMAKIKKTIYGGPCMGGGMAVGCDFADVQHALNHDRQLSSSHFPGRRKRSYFRRESKN